MALKTGDGVTYPRVQISPPPPYFLGKLKILVRKCGSTVAKVRLETGQLLQPFREIGFTHNCIAPIHSFRLMACQFHRHRPWYASSLKISNRSSGGEYVLRPLPASAPHSAPASRLSMRTSQCHDTWLEGAPEQTPTPLVQRILFGRCERSVSSP